MKEAVARAMSALQGAESAFRSVEALCRHEPAADGDHRPTAGKGIQMREVIVVTTSQKARRYAVEFVRILVLASAVCAVLYGIACSGPSPSKSFYLAVAPEYADYVGADQKLTAEQKARRFTTLEIERERLAAAGLVVPRYAPTPQTVTAGQAKEVSR